MPPKNAQKDAGDAYVVGPEAVVDIYNGFIGPDDALRDIDEEYTNLMDRGHIVLEQQRDHIADRRKQRKERFEARRRELEEKRLWEKRNNPENLALAAAQIQKYVRAIPFRQRFEELIASTGDRVKKHAIIIACDQYDDTRVREPSIVAQDAFDIAKILQHTGFAVDVYSSRASNPKFKPTKANISAVLEEAAKETPADTFLWVHVCGHGATGTVSGKNPFKAAQQDPTAKATPRTRMIRALQANHRAPGQTSGSTMGDITKFILPTDSRSARLTYDTVIPIDELMQVVDARHMQCIHGQPIAQRILTVDAVNFGAVDGQQGGGFGIIASTATGRVVVEMPQAYSNPRNPAVVESHRGVVSRAVLNKLVGDGWRRVRVKRSFDFRRFQQEVLKATSKPSSPTLGATAKGGRRKSGQPLGITRKTSFAKQAEQAQKQAAANAKTDLADDSPGSPAVRLEDVLPSVDEDGVPLIEVGFTATMLMDAIVSRAKNLHLQVEVTGKRWGDIPIMAGERVAIQLANLERIFGTAVDPAFGVAAESGIDHMATSTAALTESGSVSVGPRGGSGSAPGGKRSLAVAATRMRHKPRPPAFTRGCAIEVSLGVLTTVENLVSPFDNDFLGVLFNWASVLAQPDPTVPAARWLKLQPAKTATGRRLCIGLGTTFVDVATKLRTGAGVVGGRGLTEAQLWTQLVERLLQRPEPVASDKRGGNGAAGRGRRVHHQQDTQHGGTGSHPNTPGPSSVTPGAHHLEATSPTPTPAGAVEGSASPPRADRQKSVTLPPLETPVEGRRESSASPARTDTQSPSAATDGQSSNTPSPGAVPSSHQTPKAAHASSSGSTSGSPGASGAILFQQSTRRQSVNPYAVMATDQPPEYSLYTGKPEEGGGIMLALTVRTAEELRTIVGNLDAIPEVLDGVRHTMLRVEVDLELMGCVKNLDCLRDHARGWYQPFAEPESADDDILALVARAKRDARRRATDAGGQEVHPLGPCHVTPAQMQAHLERLCQGTVKKPAAFIPLLSKGQHSVNILRVRPRVQRINDVDDYAFEALRSRERPSTIVMPYPVITGMAVCVVAMAGTPELRARQAVELAHCARSYELYHGIRFMLWDITETLWLPPGVAGPSSSSSGGAGGSSGQAPSNASVTASALNAMSSGAGGTSSSTPQHHLKRDKIGRLLEAIKTMIASTSFPALLVLDFFKKRYYQTRLGLNAPVYTADQIAQFCDVYSRGGLNDLLPPVKGCRVHGGSVARTKYTLIAV